MKWINKNKKMPPLGRFKGVSIYVLVSDGKNIGTGVYDYGSKKWTYELAGYIEMDDNEITHWAIPRLPKRKKWDYDTTI
jgi:hypothetical protein